LRAGSLCLFLALAALPLASVAAARPSDDPFARAEQALVSAYNAVRQAEDAGADISPALTELNDAASSLALAQALYREGRSAEAVEAADRTSTLASKVTEDASWLRERATAKAAELLTLALIEWAAIVSATVLLGHLAWGWFARWYHSRLLGMVVAEAGQDEP